MLTKILAVAALAAISVPAMAGTPRLDAREHNQRERIAQGVRSGELTRPETRRLIAGERRLHRHERYAKSDGIVMRGERIRLQRNTNRMSHRIYRQKHDPLSR